MKKIIACILALVLCAMCASSFAEEFDWFELDTENGNVLTVRLPADESDGYWWQYELGEGCPIECVTEEYVEGESEEDAETFVASFVSIGEGSGYAQFDYMAPGDEEAADTYFLYFNVDAEGKISMVGAVTDSPSYGWCGVDEEGTVLTANLPADTAAGYEWDFEFSDDAALDYITYGYTDEDTANCAENEFAASFWAIAEDAGEQEVYFYCTNANYDDAVKEVRIAYINIAEDKTIEVQGLETINYWLIG